MGGPALATGGPTFTKGGPASTIDDPTFTMGSPAFTMDNPSYACIWLFWYTLAGCTSGASESQNERGVTN